MRLPSPPPVLWPLPRDVTALFLEPLAHDVSSLCACACVCTSWREAASSPHFWSSLHLSPRIKATLNDARLASLLRRTDGRLTWLDLSGCDGLSVASLALCAAQPRLVGLRLAGCGFDEASLCSAFDFASVDDAFEELRDSGAPHVRDSNATPSPLPLLAAVCLLRGADGPPVLPAGDFASGAVLLRCLAPPTRAASSSAPSSSSAAFARSRAAACLLLGASWDAVACHAGARSAVAAALLRSPPPDACLAVHALEALDALCAAAVVARPPFGGGGGDVCEPEGVCACVRAVASTLRAHPLHKHVQRAGLFAVANLCCLPLPARGIGKSGAPASAAAAAEGVPLLASSLLRAFPASGSVARAATRCLAKLSESCEGSGFVRGDGREALSACAAVAAALASFPDDAEVQECGLAWAGNVAARLSGRGGSPLAACLRSSFGPAAVSALRRALATPDGRASGVVSHACFALHNCAALVLTPTPPPSLASKPFPREANRSHRSCSAAWAAPSGALGLVVAALRCSAAAEDARLAHDALGALFWLLRGKTIDGGGRGAFTLLGWGSPVDNMDDSSVDTDDSIDGGDALRAVLTLLLAHTRDADVAVSGMWAGAGLCRASAVARRAAASHRFGDAVAAGRARFAGAPLVDEAAAAALAAMAL